MLCNIFQHNNFGMCSNSLLIKMKIKLKRKFIMFLQNIKFLTKTVILVKVGLHLKIISSPIWYSKNCWLYVNSGIIFILLSKSYSIYQGVQNVLEILKFTIKHNDLCQLFLRPHSLSFGRTYLLAFTQALLSISQ